MRQNQKTCLYLQFYSDKEVCVCVTDVQTVRPGRSHLHFNFIESWEWN